MIYYYLCPLKDMCPTLKKVQAEVLPPSLVFNWLPDGDENKCPLYKAANEHSKEE